MFTCVQVYRSVDICLAEEKGEDVTGSCEDNCGDVWRSYVVSEQK